MSGFTKPSCGRCRWAVRAIGLGFDRFTAPDEVRDSNASAIGTHHCENEVRPRGLVLTTYRCRDFEWPPEISAVAELEEQPRIAK